MEGLGPCPAQGVSASVCSAADSSLKAWEGGVYSLAEELSRKVGFSFPDLASVTKAQSNTPCHVGWCRPSQAGALGSPPALPPQSTAVPLRC